MKSKIFERIYNKVNNIIQLHSTLKLGSTKIELNLITLPTEIF